MAGKRDYYEVLEVDRHASDQAIKRAFRKLARRYHPDVNPGNKEAEGRFKELSEAYEVLGDPDKRATYDRFGHSAFSGRPEDFAGVYREVDPGGFSGLDDLLNSFFGTRRGTRAERSAPGRDNYHALNITFQDAYEGKEVFIEFMRRIPCGSCSGTGGDPGSPVDTCPRCKGQGEIRRGGGFTFISETCPECGGVGSRYRKGCSKCGASGFVSKMERIRVKVPAGVETGSKIRIPGMGEPGFRGGVSGDLYVNIVVNDHTVFERRGDNIYMSVPITLSEAALGAEIDIPTPGGRVKMKIPVGTQSGTELRLRGRGLPHLNEIGRGDLYVTLSVVIPSNLDVRSRELVREFEKRNPQDPRGSLFAKAKGG